MQVDYESEGEEEKEENSGDEQEEVTEQAEDEVASEEASKESHDTRQPSIQEKLDGDSQESMRVKKVLHLSSSIEAYRYDQEKGLWCEVQPCSLSVILEVFHLIKFK